MSENHLVTRPAAVFSGFTVLSRILGLVRDILAAAIFGASMFWDAFVVAFTFPNLFRRILGEGALSSAFVPVFSEYIHKEGKKEGWRIVNITVTLLVIILVILTVIVLGGMVLIRELLPLGEKGNLILKLLQVMFPYVIFICIVGLFMGILNTFHKLAIPAVAPAVFNLVLIVGIVSVAFLYKENPNAQIMVLAGVVLLGGVIEWIIHLPALRAVGMHYKFIAEWNNPAVKRILWLMGPMILGLGVTQINIIVDRLLALWIGNGAVSKLYFGSRLMQLPLGIFGVALAVSSFSVMSKQVARKDITSLKNTLSYSMRLILYISLPAAIGLIVLRTPIISVIFERRAFTAVDTEGCARVLLCYSLGLFAYLGLKLVIKCFYAMQDTRTPVKVAAVMVVLNLCLNLLLMIPLREAGLALATAICAVLNITILLNLLSNRLNGIGFRAVMYSGFRSGIAALIMGLTCWCIWKEISPNVAKTIFFQVIFLVGVIGAGFLVYIGCSLVLGAKEPKEIISNLRKR